MDGRHVVSDGMSFPLCMAVFMTTVVFVGFWPTYFSLLLTGHETEQDWVVHLHAAMSLAWMALFVTQTFGIARGKVSDHMKLGQYGFALGAVVVLVGYFVAIRGMNRFVSAGVVTWPEAIVRAPSPLASITTFGVLLALGFVFRSRPDTHKRFMLLATIGLLFPATSRMGYLLGPWSAQIMFVVLIGPLLGHDLRVRGRIHPAYVVGTAFLVPRLAVSVLVTLRAPVPP